MEAASIARRRSARVDSPNSVQLETFPLENPRHVREIVRWRRRMHAMLAATTWRSSDAEWWWLTTGPRLSAGSPLEGDA